MLYLNRNWNVDDGAFLTASRSKVYCHCSERAIWSELDHKNRDKVRKIRSRIEGVHTPNDLTKDENTSEIPQLAEEILELSRQADNHS